MNLKEIQLFIVCIVITLYYGATNTYDTSSNQYRGVLAGMILISVIGSLQQSNPFDSCRWLYRFQFWLAVTYNAFLIFLFFQNEKDARQLMKLGDDSLGVPVIKEMHTYDDNCEIELGNILDNFDHYYLAHVINWLLAAFLVRDAYVLHFWSILDEIIELSWQHKLPHFRECWWDHIFHDVLLSNTVAITIGMYLMRKLKFIEYDWLGRKNNYQILRSRKHLMALFIILIVVIVNFLDGFFLMNSLWVPPKTWMVAYRLLVWFAMGHMAFRELHNSLTKEVSGQIRFMTYWTLFIETAISIKFLKDCGNLQSDPTPLYISIPWSIAICTAGVLYWKTK